MARPAVARLSRSRLAHNFTRAQHYAGRAQPYAVVKADAYGHGIGDVATVLNKAGAQAFAVACLEEALALRDAGVAAPVLLLEGALDRDELDIAVASDLELVIHNQPQLDALQRLSVGAIPRLWLKFDSGMHRLGFNQQALAAAWTTLRRLSVAHHLGVMTHLANADDQTSAAHNDAQLDLFAQQVDDLVPAATSVCNSAALIRGLHSDTRPRPGLMLYGAAPIIGTTAADFALEPVMTFSSKVIALHELKDGDTVGYGSTWRARGTRHIAVVAAGYGDGYPRHARNGTPVLVNSQRAPLAGRISMDMLTVDVTELATVSCGDPVTLWGHDLPVEQIAEYAGTIAYELLCGVTSRVRRVWVD